MRSILALVRRVGSGPLDRTERPQPRSLFTNIVVTMVMLRLPDEPAVPLHERIAAAVRRAVAEGRIADGARLPSASELGAAMDVHPNTVLRAYRALRDDGLIDLRRGRGATVRSGAAPAARIALLVDELIATGRREGYDRRELAALVAGGAAASAPRRASTRKHRRA